MTGTQRRDLRGLVRCPWGCGETVRRTVNARARTVYVNPDPDLRGIIAAYWDGDLWRSRQLHKGEGTAAHEDRWLIHRATCQQLAHLKGRPAKPPRLVVVPPPPGPIPDDLARQAHQELERVRQRQRAGQDRP